MSVLQPLLKLLLVVLEPTPAITDASNLVEEGKALIAIADNLCNLAVYRYDGSRLEQLWHKLQDLERKHSSPLITHAGHLIIGDEEGKVTAFEVQTGREDWTYDAEEPALGTPAVFSTAFILSKRHIHMVHPANGHQIDKHAFASDDEVYTLSSPAISTKWVHIAHDRGLVSYKLSDLSVRAHDPNYKLGVLSPSPAIGPEGELYVIHDSTQLWAYPRP